MLVRLSAHTCKNYAKAKKKYVKRDKQNLIEGQVIQTMDWMVQSAPNLGVSK